MGHKNAAAAHAEFVRTAHPHSWFQVADDLFEQARILRTGRDGQRILKDSSGSTVVYRPAANRAVFLVGGFSLENAIKAFLVYEHPSWISNGRLAGPLKSHSLTKLADKSSLLPYRRELRWVLRAFEDGLESWARYPCALSVEDNRLEGEMEERLWKHYEKLMKAYSRRLQRLLSTDWPHAPHGFTGHFEIRGEWLGYTANKL